MLLRCDVPVSVRNITRVDNFQAILARESLLLLIKLQAL